MDVDVLATGMRLGKLEIFSSQLEVFDLDYDLPILDLSHPTWEELSDGEQSAVEQNWIRLAMIIIRTAMGDAKKGDWGAIFWLRSVGVEWLDLMGCCPQVFIGRVDAIIALRSSKHGAKKKKR